MAVYTLLSAQTILFNKTYNYTDQWEHTLSVDEEEDSYFIIHQNNGFTYEQHKVYLTKVDLEGNLVWNNFYCGGDSIVCRPARHKVRSHSRNSFLVYGEYGDVANDTTDGMILELSLEGDSLQMKRYGGDGIQGFSFMTSDPNGGYIVCGGNKGIDPSGDMYFMRIDENLEVIWETTINKPYGQIAYSIHPAPGGGYFSVGKGLTSSGDLDIISIKLDETGQLEWSQTLGGDGNNDGRHNGTVLSDGNFLVAASEGHSSMDKDPYLCKLSPEGEILWKVSFEAGGNSSFNTNILELEDGSIVVGGGKYISGTRYARIAKFTSEGEPIWEQLYHGRLPIDCYFWGIKRANDGGLIGYGTAFGPDPSTQQDGWIVKMDSEGQSCAQNADCLLVNIAEVGASGKAQLNISPNPATDNTLLHYYLPRPMDNCRLEVYNLNGQLIQSTLFGQVSQEETIQLNVQEWPAGMYVVQLQSEEGVLAVERLVKQ